MMFAIADLYPNKVFRSSPSVVKWKKPNDQTLTVLVGPEKTVYWYQPRKILRHSKYLRTELLANLMKSRGEHDEPSMTLSLPQISPSDWETMLMYMDPTKRRHQRKLNLYDAARLRKSFVECGFQQGVELCDHVLTGRKSPSPTTGRRRVPTEHPHHGTTSSCSAEKHTINNNRLLSQHQRPRT